MNLFTDNADILIKASRTDDGYEIASVNRAAPSANNLHSTAVNTYSAVGVAYRMRNAYMLAGVPDSAIEVGIEP